MKLRQQEADNYKKSLNEQNALDNSLVSTAEALRAEDEKRMMNGADLRREYGESAAYNTAFDKLSALAEKLNNSDLNDEEKSGILSKELANILQDAQ